MSWIDLVKNNLIIVTGDGREYKPLWKDPQKVIEYNVSQFEFPGVEGSIVSRGTPKGRKFPLEIYFVGESHLDECEQFEISASDKRHWVVTHPYYGVLNVHPTSINIDNTGGNVSKLSITLIETIVENYPKGIDRPSDKISEMASILYEKLNVSLVNSIPKPNVKDRSMMIRLTSNVYNEGKKKIKLTLDAENYFNLFNDATAGILNSTDDVLQAAITINAMINAPFQFTDTVKNRVGMLLGQFDKLITTGKTAIDLFKTPTEKRIYENSGASLIGTMAQASITNIDYANSEEVLSVMEDIIDVNESFIQNLDSLQTTNGGNEDSYIPDAESMIGLQDVVNYTVSKLLEVALESKQERSIITETDTNIIILTHRLYGLQVDDSTIEYLITTNGLGLIDMLQIMAGRKIKYYV